MAGMYHDSGDKDGGKGLPDGHWMHGVMAKEKARLSKRKGNEGGSKHPTSPASVQAVSTTPVTGGAPC